MNDRNLIILCKSLNCLENLEINIFKSFLKGFYTEKIMNLKLQKDPYFGIFSHYEFKEIEQIIKYAEDLTLIEITSNISLTDYGKICSKRDEICQKIKAHEFKEICFSKEELEEITKYEPFLEKLNLEQKKAVISKSNRIICIAGAGSGKTTVLAKRIEHLVFNHKQNPEKILAITFTKKAKENMQKKLQEIGINDVHINTFNSLGEKLLSFFEFTNLNLKKNIATFKDKSFIFDRAIDNLNINKKEIIEKYFGKKLIQDKNFYELKNKFIQDCFIIRDYFNNNAMNIEEFYKNSPDVEMGKQIYSIVKFIDAYFKKQGFRDYSDQIFDCIKLFKEHEERIPVYDHILIDEYQDINLAQKEMIDLIITKNNKRNKNKTRNNLKEHESKTNLFCVGDPRQAIYGWRGSRIEFIQNFENSEVIYLTTNYRSGNNIVELGNKIIDKMNLPNLISTKPLGEIEFNRFETNLEEAIYVAKKIKESKFDLNEIYVIGRTNLQLEEISKQLDLFKIEYNIKTDSYEEENNGVSLMTAHCSKGLEAKEVFVIGCTSRLYPCIKSEHKILDFVKDYYNKKEEELRLLYVAITRAQTKLHISYFGKILSPFLIGKIIEQKENIFDNKNAVEVKQKLIFLRQKLSGKYKIPEFLIFNDEELEKMSQLKEINIKNIKTIIGARANRFGEYILDV